MDAIVRKNNLVPRLSLNKILMRQGSVISQEEIRIVSVKWLTIYTSLVASLGYVTIGTFVAWSSKFITTIGNEEYVQLGIQKITWLSSVIALVAAVVTILVYKVYYFVGTKKTIFFAATLMISSLIVIFSFDVNFHNILISRVVAGFGMGILYLLIPVYLHELVTNEYKFMAENMLSVAFAFGILFQYGVDCLDDSPFRYILPFMFPLFFIIGFMFLPESPKYLYINNHILEARQILEKYRESSEDIDCEFDQWNMNVEKREKLSDLFSSLDNAKVMVPIIGLVFFQQIIGVTALFFYLDNIFMLINTHAIPIKPSMIIGIIFMIAIPLYELFSIKIKHRTNLLWTTFSKSLILAVLGWYCHTANIRGMTNQPNDASYIPVACYSLILFFYTIGLYRLTNRYIAVLSNDRNYFGYKTITISLSWFIIFALVKCLPNIINDIGVGWIFWTMSLLVLMAWLFIYYFVPHLPNVFVKMLPSCSTSDGSSSSSSRSSPENSPSLTNNVEFA